MFVITEAVITCPNCEHQQQETMPLDACMYFYQCPGCTVLLKPLAGDCCVFCSYSPVKCPPLQIGKSCCA
ncbi:MULTISPECIES: GDCCVxC domain-containing (seleno)protein [Larkinella]|uniref:Uncharacterized protein n=1 Tax=Larkinella punicea TaxID=2315727 RepID=A0A368JIC7_9BACT|nr:MULTISPECIES: GDCCVxC domain-containing (seleno)protein [Larkinella]RCR67045.1 hypothetical protein DUE52_23600 [Larkinella punicea]